MKTRKLNDGRSVRCCQNTKASSLGGQSGLGTLDHGTHRDDLAHSDRRARVAPPCADGVVSSISPQCPRIAAADPIGRARQLFSTKSESDHNDGCLRLIRSPERLPEPYLSLPIDNLTVHLFALMIGTHSRKLQSLSRRRDAPDSRRVHLKVQVICDIRRHSEATEIRHASRLCRSHAAHGQLTGFPRGSIACVRPIAGNGRHLHRNSGRAGTRRVRRAVRVVPRYEPG